MEKKRKVFVLFCIYGIIIAVALGVYASYLHDKPKIDAENQAVLNAQQAASGIKDFINSTTTNLNNSPIPIPKP